MYTSEDHIDLTDAEMLVAAAQNTCARNNAADAWPAHFFDPYRKNGASEIVNNLAVLMSLQDSLSRCLETVLVEASEDPDLACRLRLAITHGAAPVLGRSGARGADVLEALAEFLRWAATEARQNPSLSGSVARASGRGILGGQR